MSSIHSRIRASEAQRKGKITARPLLPDLSTRRVPRGVRAVGLETERDSFLYVPDSYSANSPAPLLVMLHGAGGNVHHAIDPLKDLADRTGTLILAPQSQSSTWDVLSGGFGPDVYFIEQALEEIFSSFAIDPQHIAAAGFSDGASYALTLGLANGELFSHLIAFSPGFATPADLENPPHVFLSHGTSDTILPIDSCSRRIRDRLRAFGVDISYEEFEGGHTIPPDIARKAFVWYLGFDAIPETKDAMVRSREAGIEFT